MQRCACVRAEEVNHVKRCTISPTATNTKVAQCWVQVAQGRGQEAQCRGQAAA